MTNRRNNIFRGWSSVWVFLVWFFAFFFLRQIAESEKVPHGKAGVKGIPNTLKMQETGCTVVSF